MHAWLSFKNAVAAWSHLDAGALIILSSLLITILLALAVRRPISSILVLLLVLAVGLANAAIDFLVLYGGRKQALAACGHDLALFMTVPLALLILGRAAPRLLVSSARDTHIKVPVRMGWDGMIEAEFEEVDEPAPARRAG